MNQLLDDYFRRDLSGPEEDQLGDWLASDPEAAQSLIRRMEEHYLSLKPVSVIPDWVEQPLPDFFPKPRLGPGSWVLLGLSGILLFGLGEAISRFWPQSPTSIPQASVQTQAAIPASASNAPGKRSASRKPTSHPDVAVSGKTYEELSVVVDNAVAGLATVRVVDKLNQQVQLIFAGILPAGRRTFTWDGHRADGKVSQPGIYYLVVESGAKVLRQKVEVR